MADNYIERREEEIRNACHVSVRSNNPSLDELLVRNRSCRGFDSSYIVHARQLMAMVEVNTKIASARNAQNLRFKLVTHDTPGIEVLAHFPVGGALPELKLPLPGTEANAFIVVCSKAELRQSLYVDVGVSLQSMSLKAVEMGLNTLIIFAFDRAAVKKTFDLDCEPLALLAVGKSIEKYRLVPPREDGSLQYYREDGVHFIPKLPLEKLII